MKNHMSLKNFLRVRERRHILFVLKACKNNKSKAAEILEIGVSSLYRKIDELKLKGVFK